MIEFYVYICFDTRTLILHVLSRWHSSAFSVTLRSELPFYSSLRSITYPYCSCSVLRCCSGIYYSLFRHAEDYSVLRRCSVSIMVHSDIASDYARGCRRNPELDDYMDLLFRSLEIGFRLAAPDHDQPVLHLNHTPHHDRIFEAAFSSDDDEVIADAVWAWIAGSECAPAGSLARHFANRMEKATPSFPRLRQIVIHAIRHIWYKKLAVPVWRLFACWTFLT